MSATAKTIAELASDCLSSRWTPEYRERMIHKIPDAPVVDREAFIVKACKGKKVLNLGSNGTDSESILHKAIKEVAHVAVGVDRTNSDFNCDLDEQAVGLWTFLASDDNGFQPRKPNLIIAGEILEHLGNPGNLLKTLRGFQCPVIITVPNAFANGSHRLMEEGFENVNKDHVAWYSYRTLKTLVERYGFSVSEFCWYKGRVRFAEGLIMRVE